MVLYKGRRETECETKESKMKKQKADISLGDTEKERDEVVKRIAKIQKLMKQFDMAAYAFDPGVRCLEDKVIKEKKVIDFDGDTWAFTEPLLRELVQWREYGKKFNMYMGKKERRKYEKGSKRL